jgi:hypothetical protein
MTDRMRREQTMKRTAIVLGIVAAMGVVPSVASAGGITTQQKTQQKPQVVVQILKPQPVRTARYTVARVSSQRFSTEKISLLRIHAR